jgi:hypothetical protein
LAEEEGQNARQLFEEHFTKEQAIDRYYRLLCDDEHCPRIRDGAAIPQAS